MLLLVAVPTADARSFEAERIVGSFAFQNDPTGQAAITINSIGAGSRIVGPRTLRGIDCVDGSLDLSDCATLRYTRRQAIWVVLQPVSLVHMGVGGFSISLTRAIDVEGVFVSGCGRVRVRGSGSFSADDADVVSYTPDDSTRVVSLEP